ncbi:hypothetical protein D9M72_573720 [compost metagenome]
MHTVDIGIGCDYDIVVTQVAHILLYIQSRLEQVEFFVFVDNLFAHAIRIQRFSTQAENGLGINVTRFRNGTRSRISLGDKKRAF